MPSGIPVVTDMRIVNGETVQYYFSEKMFGYAKSGKINQFDFREFEKLDAPYAIARLCAVVRRFDKVSEFAGTDDLIANDIAGWDSTAWTRYGDMIIPKLQNGMMIPLKTIDISENKVDANINHLVYIFVDQKEFETLKNTLPADAIYQQYIEDDKPSDIKGAIVFVNGNTLYTIGFFIGYGGEWVNPMMASSNIAPKFRALYMLSSKVNSALLYTHGSVIFPAGSGKLLTRWV
jgi:hypothetical protein